MLPLAQGWTHGLTCVFVLALVVQQVQVQSGTVHEVRRQLLLDLPKTSQKATPAGSHTSAQASQSPAEIQQAIPTVPTFGCPYASGLPLPSCPMGVYNGSFYEDLVCEYYFIPQTTAVRVPPSIAGCVIEGGNSYLPTACGRYLSIENVQQDVAVAQAVQGKIFPDPMTYCVSNPLGAVSRDGSVDKAVACCELLGTYEFSVLGQTNLLANRQVVSYHDYCFGTSECGFPSILSGGCNTRTPSWVTQRLQLGYETPSQLLQPLGLATLGNYVFCTFYIYASTGVCTTCQSEQCQCNPCLDSSCTCDTCARL